MQKFDLYQSVLDSATALRGEFDSPDDDWEQFMFVETRDEGRAIVALSDLMGEAAEKEALDKMLEVMLREMGAKRVVILLNAFRLEGEAAEEFYSGSGLRPSQHPERIESLFVKEFTSEGCTRSAIADIYRDGEQPPSLSEWREAPTEGKGRFHDRIIAALAA